MVQHCINSDFFFNNPKIKSVQKVLEIFHDEFCSRKYSKIVLPCKSIKKYIVITKQLATM